MRDAVVLADQRVEERLARSRVAHRRRERGEQRAVARVVPLEQRLVGPEAHLGGHVVALGLAHQRVDDDPVRELQRQLGQVLVGPVDRVARLEPGHPGPAPLRDAGAQVARAQPVAREGRLFGEQRPHFAGHQVRRPREEIRDAGVGALLRAVHGAGLRERVAPVHLAHHDRAGEVAGGVPQGDRGAALESGRVLVGNGERERERPHGAAGEPEAREHALVVLGAEEAGEGAGRTRGDQLQVGQLARVERQRRQGPRGGAECIGLGGRDDSIDQGAAVRLDERRHLRTPLGAWR